MPQAHDNSVHSASNWHFSVGAYAYSEILSAFVTPQSLKL